MSILRSLNTGAAGLRAHGEAISVASDNIANINSVGFKRSRADFQDVLGRSIAGSSAIPQAGAGSRMAHIETMWEQGALLTTEAPTDLAISGDGFFVVNGNVGGTVGDFYTRAGQFHIDNEGRLVNPDKLRLQGYSADATGALGSERGDIVVSGDTVPANPTTSATISVNLPATDTEPAAWVVPTPGAPNPTFPTGMYNHSTSLPVYDSLGASHEVTVYFRKELTEGQWSFHVLADGAELGTGTPAGPTEIGDGILQFTTSGELDYETENPHPAGAAPFAPPTPAAAQWINAEDATIAFDFGTSLAEAGTGLDGSTSFAADFTTTGLSQDGYTAGTVSSIGIESDGTVTGVFSNGQRRTLAQVVVADFASVDGLARGGQGLWVQTRESGDALIGAPETAGRGSIVSGALEQSNVDIGREFVDLIAFQRGFSANARIISTADDMYQEAVSLKR